MYSIIISVISLLSNEKIINYNESCNKKYSKDEFELIPKFFVASGPCLTVKKDTCVQTDNYPFNYSNKKCSIYLSNKANLSTEMFSTEQYNDNLYIKNENNFYSLISLNYETFSGFSGPNGLISNGPLLWDPDNTITDYGWRICASKGNP